MSSCHQAEALFGAYWDDEATVAERDWLESHFKTCTRCPAEYEQYARTLEAVHALPRLEPRPEFTRQVLTAARQASPAADAIRLAPTEGVRWMPVAAAAALVLVAAISLYPRLASTPGHDPIAQQQPTVPPSATAQVEPVATSGTLPQAAAPRVTGAVAVVTDSLFDHTADVEFMLEPVQLQRGRAHTGSRLPDGVQGDQVVITF